MRRFVQVLSIPHPRPALALTLLPFIGNFALFRLDPIDAGPFLHLIDLIAQEGRFLELQIGRRGLHLLLQFAQEFAHAEVATGLLNDR